MNHGRPLPSPMGLRGSSRLILDQKTKGQRARGCLVSNEEPGGKTQMSLRGLCLSRLEANKVISAFLFDPSL